METYWLLVFMWFTPEEGLMFAEYTSPPENAPMYQSYEECINDGIDLANEMAAEGIPMEAMNGQCYLVVVE